MSTVHLLFNGCHHRLQFLLAAEITWAKDVREVVIGVARVQCRNQIRKRPPVANLRQCAEGTRTAEIASRGKLFRLRGRQRRGESQEGLMLRFQLVIDLLVQLLIRGSGLCGIEIAAADDVNPVVLEVEGS